MNAHQLNSSFWERNRILLKGFLVGFLIMIMLIPQVFVDNLVRERAERQTQVKQEVSSKWATRQTVTGPVLILPYRAGNEIKTMFILPDQLKINGDMQPIVKKRSLYKVTLYNSSLAIEGKFGPLPLDKLGVDRDAILWSSARLVLDVTDVHGVAELVQAQWDNTKQDMDPGMPDNKMFTQGLSMPVNINPNEEQSFSLNLHLRGSENLYFVPVGKTTEVNISSPWKDPKFDGQTLPETSDIGKDHFKAHWKVLSVSHTYPQYWKDMAIDLSNNAFGVSLIQTVDGYAKTNRSVKYAILFIALTFTFFYFLEVLLKKQVHAMQYILVGMALIIFYTLLLSISEYTGFDWAYLIAAAATVTLISSYVWGIFKNGKTAMGFTCSLAGLYGYIYILIQLEDYALLFGSIGLFLILAVIMHYSRKIDWNGTTRNKQDEPTGLANRSTPEATE